MYNFVNPVQRDVVSAGLAGDNVTIRFKTDNAGPWILHCHIDWHLEMFVRSLLHQDNGLTFVFSGLAVVFAEDVAKVAQSNPPSKRSPRRFVIFILII